MQLTELFDQKYFRERTCLLHELKNERKFMMKLETPALLFNRVDTGMSIFQPKC